jgi:hypothetical protein
MKGTKVSIKGLPKRIWLSASSLLKLLYFKPLYLLLAVAVSIVFYELIFWLLNISLLNYLLTSPYLSLESKFDMLIGSYGDIFMWPLAPLLITLFIVSILQGVAVAALVYSIKQERSMQSGLLKDFSSTGVAGALSAIGLGCAACGTSLIAPIVTFFFATSSAAIIDKVGIYSALLALIVSLAAVYLAGIKLSSRLKV